MTNSCIGCSFHLGSVLRWHISPISICRRAQLIDKYLLRSFAFSYILEYPGQPIHSLLHNFLNKGKWMTVLCGWSRGEVKLHNIMCSRESQFVSLLIMLN